MPQYHDLSFWHVAIAATLVLVNGAISVVMRLGLEKTLALASIRTVAQLLLLGFTLQYVFAWDRWYIVLALGAAMTAIAGFTASRRNERRYPGALLNTVASVWVSSWVVTAFALFAVMHGIDHWYQPQYAIPLLGMVLGNTLNGISLGLNSFTEALASRRNEIETMLALGATRREAARPAMQHAVRIGMTPIINAMMVVGLVSLPGMMTGQLMSGMSPMQAVKYQIVIMFLIASATGLGVFMVVQLSYLQVFNRQHQFLADRLVKS